MIILNILLIIILFLSLGFIISECIDDYQETKEMKKLYKFNIDDEDK